MFPAHSIITDGPHQPPTPLFFEGRYRKMFPSQQLLAWQAYEQGLIEPLGLRCYCVLHEMAERRSYSDSPAHYRVPECHKLLDTTRRISEVEKLVCAPAPFQSPAIGLGSKVADTPKSSATR